MARDIKEVWKKWEDMVKSKATYLFEPVDDEDDFESFEGVPVQSGTELAVKVTKGNGSVNDGTVIWIDASEFCFMSATKVKA